MFKGRLTRGFCLAYKPYTNWETARFHHILYGRLHHTYKKFYDTTYVYYYPGILHNIKFKRMNKTIIYLEDYPAGLLRKLKPYCREISLTEIEFSRMGMKTGEEYWRATAKKKGIEVKWVAGRKKGKRKEWNEFYGPNTESKYGKKSNQVQSNEGE